MFGIGLGAKIAAVVGKLSDLDTRVQRYADYVQTLQARLLELEDTVARLKALLATLDKLKGTTDAVVEAIKNR